MDAHPRSVIEPYLEQIFSEDLNIAPEVGPVEEDDFPPSVSSVPVSTLDRLSDALFDELDSETPDLRAAERYRAVCDELDLRRITSGVA